MNKIINDSQKIAKIVSEINNKINLISNTLPKGNEHILKHIAASSIHMALFLRDLYEITFNIKEDYDKGKENKFLECCGCDFNGVKK